MAGKLCAHCGRPTNFFMRIDMGGDVVHEECLRAYTENQKRGRKHQHSDKSGIAEAAVNTGTAAPSDYEAARAAGVMMKQWIIFSCLGIIISFFLPWEITGGLSQSVFDLFLEKFGLILPTIFLASGPLSAVAIAYIEFRQIRQPAIYIAASIFCVLYLGLVADPLLPDYIPSFTDPEPGIGSYLGTFSVLMLFVGRILRAAMKRPFFDRMRQKASRVPAENEPSDSVFRNRKTAALTSLGLALLLVGGWLLLNSTSDTGPSEEMTDSGGNQAGEGAKTESMEQALSEADRRAERDAAEYTRALEEKNRRLRDQLAAQQQVENRRQQAIERQRVCGGWTCVRLEDGTVLLQTQDGSAWMYRDGELAPRDIWPR